jgi:hypothetical protein
MNAVFLDVDLARIDVSEERVSYIFRVAKILQREKC